jgi:hypothetical protein
VSCQRALATASKLRSRSTSVDEKSAHSLKDLVEFLDRHFSNRLKNEVLFDCEKALRTNKARPVELAALTIAFIQRNRERIPVPAAGDLAQNQIRAREIGNDQRRPAFSAVAARKRNDNDFACYRFDHAVSSSGEFQSRPRTDSLSSAPLNALFFSESFGSSGFISFGSLKV